MPSQLPIENYTFVLTRLRYLSAAVTNAPDFKPDGKPAAAFTPLPALAEQAYAALLVRFNAANFADGTLHGLYSKAYEAAVTVYACMKSCYRTDLNCKRAIRSLPKAERTPEKTLVRMKALVELWGALPNVPGTSAPLEVGEYSAGSFGSLTGDFDAKVTAARLENSRYSGALAFFHQQLNGWDGLVSAAATQGRALFKPGTPQRAYIDRIPTEPGAHKPAQAVITLAESPAAGTVHLLFTAEHATSFQVWHKAPGAVSFTPVGDVLLPGDYLAAGLLAGTHEYQIVGENSRGAGPASTPASIAVAAAQAA